MIDKTAELSVNRQCRLLGVSRSTAYYQPVSIREEDLLVMRVIDEVHLERPFLGSRRLVDELGDRDMQVNRKRVQRLMRVMDIEAIYPKPRTSRPAVGHKIYPYLLGGIDITRPNQVWSADITYLPMSRGFAYLVAIMDVYSRKVLSWRLSNSMDVSFCIDALTEALELYGNPEVFNSDQGAQFTSATFTSVLEEQGVRISMDGKGRWIDNVFIERFWRSLKYEEVYLKAYADLNEARLGLSNYLRYYNGGRRHSSLDRRTPDEVYSADVGFQEFLPAVAASEVPALGPCS
jgi:putative transposase